MLDKVSAVLRSVLAAWLPGDVELRFDAPSPSWPDDHQEMVNLFLYRVREDLRARTGSWLEQRDDEGRVVGRGPASRRYQLHYVATAWARTPEREHALLGKVLETFASMESLTPAHLTSSSFGEDAEVAVSIAHPELPTAPIELWTALRVAPRCALDLVVVAPLASPVVVDLAPAPAEVEIVVSRPPTPEPRPDPAVGRPLAHIQEGPI